MSDATERPAGADPDADPEAWAAACEEDLAAERARRRERYGTPPGSAAEELRRLADAVTGKLTELGGPVARGVVQQFVTQARAAVEPVVERNPRVFDHLAAAGGELLAAYRAAVEDQERRWTSPGTDRERIDLERTGPEGTGGEDRDTDRGRGRGGDGDGGEDGPAGSERIDLD
ncbi:hypothetical protein CUT44_07660 [Streptomyces carminius]|uniref:DUF5304 domain-containing protein n=1 Tax=Streptomyces carminius TaxID=2665496 RepID=A0A2M8M2Y5_9ACTN|nr:DUF5304 family protein [Streptomyces carminius]PJE98558.1 hypothetical protein CUT44_07660 [Streptomyces carminius]